MSFLNALTEAQDGLVVHTLDQRFDDLKQAVLDLKTKGKMSISVTVLPGKFNSKGEVIMIDLDWQCEVKKPALQPGSSSFFVDDDGNLCRNPPNQMTIQDIIESKEKK